jgi:hypothetical protein
MTEGETKAAPQTPEDKDFERRDAALEREIEQDEATETQKPPKLDHATDGGVI